MLFLTDFNITAMLWYKNTTNSHSMIYQSLYARLFLQILQIVPAGVTNTTLAYAASQILS